MPSDFDVVVVGAGPAGAVAALVAARAGNRVCLLERGPQPGSKNLFGGVIYGRVLDALLPGWWQEAPVQRWVTRRSTMVLTDTQALTIDFRTQTWAGPPYNGATAYRPDFDAWLADKAVEAGATLVCSTTVTGLLRDDSGRAVGVRTDRPGGDITAAVVIACDGVNSFLAKEAGLYPHGNDAHHFTLGVKEVRALPRDQIEARFAVRGREGADIEILGCTGDVPGGGFVYTNLDTIAIGVVLHLPALAASGRRPEDYLADLKAHPTIAPLLEGSDLKEYGAHLIPEGGLDAMPALAGDGIVVAGDAAGLCLAAGIWLEGVNFAIGSGAAAGAAAVEAIAANDTSAAGLAGYRRRLEETFVLKDHRRLRRAPGLVLSKRVQQQYPKMVCDLVEQLFTVDNPRPKPGGVRAAWQEFRRSGVRVRDVLADLWTALRTYG